MIPERVFFARYECGSKAFSYSSRGRSGVVVSAAVPAMRVV